MADVKTAEGPRESIPNCRLRVRNFNNKIKDAQLDDNYKDVPCKDCRKPILEEASELQNECGRLKDHYRKDEMSPSQIAKVCCDTCSKDDKKDTPQDNKDNICIKEAMSGTRKIIRDHNDNLDDLRLASKNGDGRLCERCRESLLKECQGLVDELKRTKDQLQENNMKDKCLYPCYYGIGCAHMNVEMRDGAKGRSKIKQRQQDSGYHSVNSEILGKEPTESMDDNQTASAGKFRPFFFLDAQSRSSGFIAIQLHI